MTTIKPIDIYLDQNKWIDLSRAYYDKGGCKTYRKILERIRVGISSQTIAIPLSSEHILETRKVRDRERDVSMQKRANEPEISVTEETMI